MKLLLTRKKSDIAFFVVDLKFALLSFRLRDTSGQFVKQNVTNTKIVEF